MSDDPVPLMDIRWHLTSGGDWAPAHAATQPPVDATPNTTPASDPPSTPPPSQSQVTLNTPIQLSQIPPIISNTLNLSSTKLSSSALQLLDLGLSFVPTPDPVPTSIYQQSLHHLGRRLSLIDFFSKFNKPSPNPSQGPTQIPFSHKFKNPSTWLPPSAALDPNTITCTTNLNNLTQDLPLHPHTKHNLTPPLKSALFALKRNHNIVLKPADKSPIAVVMDYDDYIYEIQRQLSNPAHYQSLNNPLTQQNSQSIQLVLNDLFKEGHISRAQLEYLQPPTDPKPRVLYTLPKIHKPPHTWPVPFKIPPGRPIVSDCGSETYRVSSFLDHLLQPLSTTHPAYVKDSFHFKHLIDDLHCPPHAYLISMDIKSMYTNIDNDLGLQAVQHMLAQSPQHIPTHHILSLLSTNLKGNDFMFRNQRYLQVSGTAMGKAFAPSYANITMAYLEKQLLPTCPKQPLFYKRFLDDIFLIWDHPLSDFHLFFQTFNNFHPSIQFTYESSSTHLDFLDMTIFKPPSLPSLGKLHTKIHFKPTNTHQFLHTLSHHPPSTFQGIVKSQFIRYKRLSTTRKDFDSSCNTLIKALIPRGYKKRKMSHIKNLVWPNNTHCLPSKNGFYTCLKPRCRTCPYSSRAHTFRSHTHSKVYTIKQKLTCESKNLVYLITCSFCGLQYVGQTKNSLRVRHTQHKYSILSQKDTPVSHHFNSPNHSLQHYTILAIEGVKPGLRSSLDSREGYWISKLGTLSPQGLNLAPPPPPGSIPFIIPYSRATRSFSFRVRDTVRTLQESSYPFRSKRLVTAFRKHKSLKQHLVRSKTLSLPRQ
jgi:hypothetical protein